MGSAQSHVPEAVVAVLVVAGATAAYSYTPSSSQSRPEPEPAPALASATGKKKSKKNPAAESALSASGEQPASKPTVVSFPPVVPGSFDASSALADTEPTPEPAPKAGKSKKKKGKKAGAGVSRPVDAMSESSATAPESPNAAPARPTAKSRKTPTPKPAPAPPPVDTDGSWTRVEPKRRKDPQEATPLDAGTSDAGITTTSITGNSSPTVPASDDEEAADTKASTSDNRRTFAERMLPKPRKTGVEDMLETPDYPSVARVMRIQPGPNDKPVAGFSWADYEDVDDSRGTADDADGEDDGGWGVVKSRSRSRTQKPAATPTAPESMTKKQRQNATKRDAQKTAKAEAEAERQARLAQHKRDLERVKIAEQYSKPSKSVSGGMSAYVDENGKLVWK
ncbi:hypothetical protein DAEQUDRAFT_698641 [Daedalea quercina L-15889]|uniref:Uncharacterized protein n=1 Tax=Daedalea quercina L-15889 TaxID=1314783 RepID=A0A165LJC5_9APHY|nr:hypothetical protein DAEQUDRAFT_698641 [Daedalea quercina L-15889]